MKISRKLILGLFIVQLVIASRSPCSEESTWAYEPSLSSTALRLETADCIRVPLLLSDNRSADLMLDTGTSIAKLEPKIVKRLFFPIQDAIGRRNGLVYYRYGQIKTPLSTIECDPIAVTNLGIRLRFGTIEGIIGTRAIWDLNLISKDGEFFLEKCRERIGLSGLKRVDLNVSSDDLPYLSFMSIRSKSIGPVLIDTGCLYEVSIESKFFDDLALSHEIQNVSYTQTLNSDGVKKERIGTLKQVELFDTVCHDVQVIESDENVVGLPLLRKFNFVLSIQNSELYVRSVQ